MPQQKQDNFDQLEAEIIWNVMTESGFAMRMLARLQRNATLNLIKAESIWIYTKICDLHQLNLNTP